MNGYGSTGVCEKSGLELLCKSTGAEGVNLCLQVIYLSSTQKPANLILNKIIFFVSKWKRHV